MRVYNKTKDTQAHSHLLTWPKHLGQANCAAHIQARRASNENALRVLGLEGIDQEREIRMSHWEYEEVSYIQETLRGIRNV